MRETRILDQAFAKNDFGYVTLKQHKILDKAYAEMKASELYQTVGKDIEKKANEIIKEKCTPEWNRISEEMRQLGERVNELEKEKAAIPEDGTRETEKEEELKELHKKMSELTDEYQVITDKANAELNEYKEKRLGEEQGACFFLKDDEYKFIGEKLGWILPSKDK